MPALNARFALNAANARWGSLYDALYGTDALPGGAVSSGYDADRSAAVIARSKTSLDAAAPLLEGSWADWGGGCPRLRNPAQVEGRDGDSLLLRHHGLHSEVVVDREHPIGRGDPAGIADVVLVAALTTIVDLEDSIAAVDTEDKTVGYPTRLGLMRGDLSDTFEKGGRIVTRRLNSDRTYTGPNGTHFALPGRSLKGANWQGNVSCARPNGRDA